MRRKVPYICMTDNGVKFVTSSYPLDSKNEGQMRWLRGECGAEVYSALQIDDPRIASGTVVNAIDVLVNIALESNELPAI